MLVGSGVVNRLRRVLPHAVLLSTQPATVQHDQEQCVAPRPERVNMADVQLLSGPLHLQLFPNLTPPVISSQIRATVEADLRQHGLWGAPAIVLPEVDLTLPTLAGGDLNTHYQQLGSAISAPYAALADRLISTPIPPHPTQFSSQTGWTRYSGDEATAISHPSDDALVFDVEVLQSTGHLPTLAVAFGTEGVWYSWMSPILFLDEKRCTSPSRDLLIPLEGGSDSDRPRLVVGHNVAFDRGYLAEQYTETRSALRFLDTMSLHIAVAGLTSFQRLMLATWKRGSGTEAAEKFLGRSKHYWLKMGSQNSLAAVYELNFPEEDPLEKESREVFVKGTLLDVRRRLQELTAYCSGDVTATYKILQNVWPAWQQRFPRPVTLAGSLIMGSAYLPVRRSWSDYLKRTEIAFAEGANSVKLQLMDLAENAVQLEEEQWRDDPWLWDLDWSEKVAKLNKLKSKEDPVQGFDGMLETLHRLPKVISKTLGLPAWYGDLCCEASPSADVTLSRPRFGPWLVSQGKRITSSLLRLSWKGFIVHFHTDYGWGYLVPGQKNGPITPGYEHFPRDAALAETRRLQKQGDPTFNSAAEPVELGDINASIYEADSSKVELARQLKKISCRVRPANVTYDGETPLVIPGFSFMRLPHKDGWGKKVGNPLARGWLKALESGTLSSDCEVAGVLVSWHRCSKFWDSARSRLLNQLVVWQGDDGIILPRLVVSGTVTRRAVETAWLVAPNATTERLGSELKAMVQPHRGQVMVGADVDSQELWLAAVLGDSSRQLHGGTPIGWMTLQGSRAAGTDLHSMTAATAGITRDQAKVLNYSRIYGAGRDLTERMLTQWGVEADEAVERSKALFKATKGEVSYKKKGRVWEGGTESAMFNQLEQIAQSDRPRTPALEACISQTLEPRNVSGEFMTSRVNWVVQSSAVDFLHLLLVTVESLFAAARVKGRFNISIHDEIHYTVSWESRYRAALAIHMSNLLVRSFFAQRLGLNDLPMAVAFFSEVEVDKCMRKAAGDDSVTPSLPEGLWERYDVAPGDSLDIYALLRIMRDDVMLEAELVSITDTYIV